MQKDATREARAEDRAGEATPSVPAQASKTVQVARQIENG
jgi:hypothetical protein